LGSVATATAAAHAFAASIGFAGEPDVLRDGIRQWIATWAHQVIRQVTALPWFHMGAGDAREGGGDEKKEAQSVHERELKESVDLSEEGGFILLVETVVDVANHAFAINQERGGHGAHIGGGHEFVGGVANDREGN